MQSPTSQYLSPFPNITPDAENVEVPGISTDTNEYMHQIGALMDKARVLMQRLYSIRTKRKRREDEEKKEELLRKNMVATFEEIKEEIEFEEEEPMEEEDEGYPID